MVRIPSVLEYASRYHPSGKQAGSKVPAHYVVDSRGISEGSGPSLLGAAGGKPDVKSQSATLRDLFPGKEVSARQSPGLLSNFHGMLEEWMAWRVKANQSPLSS